jgi:hypothetical protein
VTTRLSILLFVLLFPFGAFAADSSSSDEVRTYDQNPRHLWNRLHQTLFIRVGPDGTTYGHDRLDPLFWGLSRHLLEEPSHRKALHVLDEFLSKRGERLIRDPLKRAFLQHDLWALFDWAASRYARKAPRERAELESRLAQIIRRLALTTEEIESLPDNYTRALAVDAPASLPRGLFSKESDWVNVSTGSGSGPNHTRNFGGRSTFHVLLRMPGGRAATLAYLEKLRTFERPWIYTESMAPLSPAIRLNPALPQFPAGTEWALVRRMRVVDASGSVRATSFIESVQVRRYLLVPPADTFESYEVQRKAQEFVELVASRVSGDLRDVRPGERDFFQFQAHDGDPFEASAEDLARYRGPDPFRSRMQHDVLGTCHTCHFGAGIHSIMSVAQLSSISLGPLSVWEFDPGQIPSDALYWDSYQLGLLRGLWTHPGRR